VLFFDELDALAFSRSKSTSDHTRHLVDEFLQQLDGLSGDNAGVLVLAATNMPWDVDSAMKRPGRFDRQLFVPPPDAVARAQMLRQKLATVPTSPFDAEALAVRMSHFSGADIDGVIEQAKEAVLAEILDGAEERALRESDLAAAIAAAAPTTLDWLRTARNLVKFGGGDPGYKDVEAYLKAHRLA
jgi:SpoVK/Ycf46/Vps4 family AAA+-type ATPase